MQGLLGDCLKKLQQIEICKPARLRKISVLGPGNPTRVPGDEYFRNSLGSVGT